MKSVDNTKTQTSMSSHWERLIRSQTLNQAWEHVRRRNAGPGMDRQTVAQFSEHAQKNIEALQAELVGGTYQPRPARKVVLKHDPDRPICIASVRDRVVQRALTEVLSGMFNARFLDTSFAYRSGWSLNRVRERMDGLLAQPEWRDGWFVRADIRKFFDMMDRHRLLRLLEQEQVDGQVVEVIERILRSGVLDDEWRDTQRGVPQGGALSPLLSNVYLHPLDVFAEALGVEWFRYADDMVILGRERSEVLLALTRLRDEFARLGLGSNASKTMVGPIARGFDFVGIRFSAGSRRLPASSWRALESRVAEVSGAGGEGVRPVVAEWQRWYGPVELQEVSDVGLLHALMSLVPPVPVESASERRRLLARSYAASRVRSVVKLEDALARARRWCGLGEMYADVALLELADALLPAEFGEAEAMASLDAVGVARPPMWRVGAGWEELLEWVGSRGWQQPVQQVRELLAQVRDGLVTEDDEMLLRRLVERLSGQSAYLAEKVDGRNWEMERVDGLLTPSVLLGHLQGGSRVGTYLADDDGRVRQLVFRVAGERGQVVPPWAPHFGREPEDAARWAAQLADVQTVAVQVGRVMHELALWPWIEEDSGGQRTLRCLLDEPQPVAVARMLVRRVLDEVMVVPQGVKLVPTPTEDRLGKRGGPWSYVPAGSCSRTGGRVKRLDVDGREVRLDWRALVQHPGVSAEVVQRVVHGGGRSSIVAGADVLTGELVETGRGELDKVLAGCGVLRAWYWKAQRLRHLDSTEKQTIFEVLGHLGQGVRMPAMLEILGPAGVTEGDLQQRLRRLPSMPIACRTVRERFAAMGQSAPCERCEFGRLPRGAYPTPVLWAVGVDELPGVKQKVEQVAGRPGSRGQAKEVPVVRRRTTGESSPGRSSASSAAPVQPAAAPVMVKPAPAPLPVTAPSSADRVLSPEPRTQKSSASEPTVMEEFASALEQMTRVKEQIRNAERGLEKVEARLNALFDRLETEEVELPMGRLVRVSRQPAQFQLLL